MTDRVPGAPGQYTMTVSAEEAQKLLTGKSVTVTLVRNDQPLVEGTPYNKASVLPDDLAAQICPNVSDPTPADALRALLPKTGGVMTGPVNMNNQKLSNLPEPAADSDAATLKTVKNQKAKELWRNSSLNADFAGKTVSVAGLSDHILAVVEVVGSTTSGGYSNYVKTVVVATGNLETVAELSGAPGELFRTMRISGNSMVFSNAYFGMESSTLANGYLIPAAIYGL